MLVKWCILLYNLEGASNGLLSELVLQIGLAGNLSFSFKLLSIDAECDDIFLTMASANLFFINSWSFS